MPSAHAQEQPICQSPVERGTAPGQVAVERLLGSAAQRHHPLLVALAGDADLATGAIEVADTILGLVAVPMVAFVAAKSNPHHGPPPPARVAPAPSTVHQTAPSVAI